MGQDEVYGWLKKHKGFHSGRTIAKHLGINNTTAVSVLARLMKRGDVERKPLPGRYRNYGYSLKEGR